MKTTSRGYLLEVKGKEDAALRKIGNPEMYELKFNRRKKAKSILYEKIKSTLDDAFMFGVRFGKLIAAKVKEIESRLTEEEMKKYIKKDTQKAKPTKYRLNRLLVFNNAMAEIEVERQRFFALYDLKVNAYLKDGYSRNQSRTNIEIMKLENQVINQVRKIVENLVFLNAQIGQFAGMKAGMK